MFYTLFKSTVNLIYPIICCVTTTVKPEEDALCPALLDADGRYRPGKSLLMKLRSDDSLGHIFKTRVFINYNSAIVQVAFINCTKQSIVIQQNKVLADEMPACLVENEFTNNKQAPPSTSHIAAASAVAAMTAAQRPTLVEQAMANADVLLSFKRKSQLEVVINKHSDVFFSGPENIGRTKLIYHNIDIGTIEPVR